MIGVINMDGLTDVLKTITGEMQKSLSARTVVGDPITVEGKTIVPLVSVGMGFGAGSGSGKDNNPSGGGGGLGLGGVSGGVSGTVQSITSTSVTIQETNGSTVTINLDGTTTYHSAAAASAGSHDSRPAPD